MTETTENKTREADLVAPEAQAPSLEVKKSFWKPGFRKKDKKNDNLRFTRKRRKWVKWLVLVVLVSGGFTAYKLMAPKSPGMPVSTLPLAKGDLVNRVGLTGMVESADTVKVYSKQTGNIDTVAVQVGDRVNAGDVLCLLDTSDLKLTIAQKQALIDQTARLNAHNLEVSKKKYEDAKNNVHNELDTALINAENAVKDAQQGLNNARVKLKDHNDGYDDSLLRAQKEEEAAYKAMKEAERDYESDKTSDKYNAWKKAEQDYSMKHNAVKDLEDDSDPELRDLRNDYKSAQLRYDQALANLKAAQNGTQQDFESYENTIKGNEIEADTTASLIELQSLQKQMAESTIVAPISGTVTVADVEEGAPIGSGPLFIIENTDDLVIKTKIKEYDIATVKEGMGAEIKADATGEATFEGQVKKIYPAAVKTATGDVKDEGTVEFETEVALTTKDTGLRVGMNVRLNVVTAEKKDVYSVPFDAVTTDMDGNDIIYIAKPAQPGEDGKPAPAGQLVAESVPVTIGMETDFYLEVSGDALADGMLVIADPTGIQPGMTVVDAAGLALAGAGMVAEG